MANAAETLEASISLLFEEPNAELAKNRLQIIVSEVVAPSIPNCPFKCQPPTLDLTSDARMELLNRFLDVLLATYKKGIPQHLRELLLDEAFIATLLLLPQNEAFFEVNQSGDTIPALLLLLACSSQRASVSNLLTRALVKPDGVYHFITNLAKGDDRLTMRALAVQVLISFPRSMSGSQYAEGVLLQMIGMLLEFKCDMWFQSIIAEAATKIVHRKPELCSIVLYDSLVKRLQEGEDLTSVARAYKALLSFKPPHSLILYTLEVNFSILAGLFEFAFRYKVLEVSSEILDVAALFIEHSQHSAALVYNWVALELYEVPYFSTDSEGRVLRSNRAEEIEALAVFMWLMNNLEKSSGLLLFSSKLFQKLLGIFSEQSSAKATGLILGLSEKFSPTELVSSPSQLDQFLKHLLVSEDCELLQGALSMLTLMLEESEYLSEDKLFLLSITPRIKELASHGDSLVSMLAQRTDQCISNVILSVELPTKSTNLSEQREHKDKDTTPFERALELHELSLSGKTVGWNDVAKFLDEPDLFVFENFATLVVSKVDITEVCQALDNFALMSDDSKVRMIEILYKYLTIPIRRPLIKAKEPLEAFVKKLLSSDSQLQLSALSLTAALFKRFGNSMHGILHLAIRTSLQSIKLSTSRVYTQQPVAEELPGALQCIKAILANVSIELLETYVQEIQEHLNLLLELYSTEDSCKVLLDAAVRAMEILLNM